MATSRWAVILCKFADDKGTTLPIDHYQRLFTSAGAGSFNMVDFFLDMSHGQIDIGASKVFGWFTLPLNKADKGDRNGLVAACRQAATSGGVNLGTFDGVLVSMNGNVDLFGYVGGMQAFCDSDSLSPSPLGQEMGHGYGLDHARRDGSDADYKDPWDVMSVYDGTFRQSSAEWGTIGPGLNAWCMRSRGWLDENRVSKSNNNVTLQLRPLHRHDLPGFLAAEIGGYLVEYRPAHRWDAAFHRSAVFIHRFEDNHSYVMPAADGRFDLVAESFFERGNAIDPFNNYIRVEVLAIDDCNLTATLSLRHRKAYVPPPVIGQIFGGVAVDGGGWIFIGGHFHPVPPRGPEVVILQQLLYYMAVKNVSDISVRSKAQAGALTAISQAVESRILQLNPLRSPATLTGGAETQAR